MNINKKPTTPPWIWVGEWEQVFCILPKRINGKRYMFRKLWRRASGINAFQFYRNTGIMIHPLSEARFVRCEYRLWVPVVIQCNKHSSG